MCLLAWVPEPTTCLGKGYYNTFSGYQAGYANISGKANAFFGAYAGLEHHLPACKIHFLGASAGYSNTTGGFNTFTGAQSGASNTTGGDNTFTGDSAGTHNTSGADNTFTGV